MSVLTPLGNFGTGTAAQIIHELTRSRGGVSMHALLGDIAFSLITHFEGIGENFSAHFAEHALIEGKPRLQWVGDHLDEVRWSMVLHAGFCQPALEMLKIKAAIARHEALPLVFANGNYLGRFVPTDLSVTTKQLMRDGTLIWVEAELTLREYVQPAVLTEETPRQEPVAAEKPGSTGAATLPAQTVDAEPAPRPANASPTRTAP
ncbi:MAG: phage tail protein [Candidatus Accumulibacter sp.]|jgi:phage protein U|nr:phage tail protein [Accumulibacter sp.]